MNQLEKEASELIHRGSFVAAQVPLRRAIKLDPNNGLLYWDLGRACYNNMDDMENGLAEAERCFRKCIQLTPGNASVYASLSNLLLIQKRYEEAIQVCDAGLKVKPPSSTCLGNKAAALSGLNRNQEALLVTDLYIAASESKSTLKSALESKAGILENLRRYSDALAVYKQLDANGHQDSYLFKQVDCLEKLGQSDEAVRVLTVIIARNRRDEDALARRARVYGRKGQLKKAEADYTKALSELKTSSFLRERAEIYKRMGRQDLYQADLKAAERL
ncbi:MAG: tetratricopeptide repeat protein [Candidatus Melainabacteria bacterium]|nr:tetratricopeptide repeat protein [Candidatus Melainabacteria bacterium]